MKRFIIAAVVVSLVATSALAISSSKASAQPPGDPFIGAWEATDADGSNLRLTIGGGPMGVHRVTLTDDGVTGGGCPFNTPAVVIGTGTVSGNVLNADDLLVRCLADGTTFLFSFAVTHDAGTDTLDKGAGVIFERVGP